MESLEQATQIIAKEIKDVVKIMAKVLADLHDFVKLLKKVASLLYSLFSSSYPLYLQVRSIIKALNSYTRDEFKEIG